MNTCTMKKPQLFWIIIIRRRNWENSTTAAKETASVMRPYEEIERDKQLLLFLTIFYFTKIFSGE